MAKLKDLELGEAALKPYSWEHTRRDGKKVTYEVAIRILTGGELDIAKARAVAYVSSLRKDDRPKPSEMLDIDKTVDDELVKHAEHYECLSVALRDSASPESPWASSHELRQKLSADEIAGLWRAYEAHQSDLGPIVRDLAPEVIDALITKLVEDPSNDPLLLFAYSARRHFTLTLAYRLELSRMDNASLLSQRDRLLAELNRMRLQSGQQPINDADELAAPDPDATTQSVA